MAINLNPDLLRKFILTNDESLVQCEMILKGKKHSLSAVSDDFDKFIFGRQLPSGKMTLLYQACRNFIEFVQNSNCIVDELISKRLDTLNKVAARKIYTNYGNKDTAQYKLKEILDAYWGSRNDLLIRIIVLTALFEFFDARNFIPWQIFSVKHLLHPFMN